MRDERAGGARRGEARASAPVAALARVAARGRAAQGGLLNSQRLLVFSVGGGLMRAADGQTSTRRNGTSRPSRDRGKRKTKNPRRERTHRASFVRASPVSTPPGGISAVHDNGVILENAQPRVVRGRWRAGFERTHLASRFPHRVRARRRVLDDRLERHLRSGARRLPRRARPARDLGFKNPRRAASRTRREVIGRAAHAAFEGQATGRRVPSARTLRPASVSILRARPSTGGTQECAAARKGRPKDARKKTRAAERPMGQSANVWRAGKSQTFFWRNIALTSRRGTRERRDTKNSNVVDWFDFWKKCPPLS